MKKILIIEDELELLEGVSDILSFEGFEIYTAPNGRIGIELAKKHAPDIILSDIMMPEVDGFEVVKTLRQYSKTVSVPIILITALSERVNIRKGMELGANDYLIKPFTRVELLESINTQLEENVESKPQSIQENTGQQDIEFNLSYEFRTSLNVILGFSNMLMSEPENYPAEAINQMVKNINEEGNNLFEIIMKYLVLIDIEVNQTSCPYSELLAFDKFLIDTIELVAKKCNRLDDVRFSTKPIKMKLSTGWIKVVVREISYNAFKFSKVGNKLKVRMNQIGSNLEIQFADEGIGQPPANVEQINNFEHFGKDVSFNQDVFGMLICKKIVAKYGGSFSIENNADDGTTISLLFPIE